MIINGVNNFSRAATVRSKTSNSIKKDSFGDVLKSSAKDTFTASSASNTAVNVGSLGVAYTQAKLDSISAEIEKTDYSGMSKAEIYADIEKRYTDAFDDYYAARVAWGCQEYEMINNQFVTEVHNHIGIWYRDTVIEARGYSGMNYEEIEAAIKEKYAGKTGFVDQLNLFSELYTSGVLSNKYGEEAAYDLAHNLEINIFLFSYENGLPTKDAWLRKVNETGISSPFTLLLNAPYLSLAEKDLFKLMVDDTLFGIADKKK